MIDSGHMPPPDELADAARRFEDFGRRGTLGSSPLYEHLALKIAQDRDLLALAAVTPRAQPMPNMLFGAVHFLLLGGIEHPLRDFYGSLVDVPRAPEAAFPDFRAFCLEHADAIRPILRTRRVQTNEVRRCVVLLPAFMRVMAAQDARPLALIEVGASAGLNLLWDRYGYDYGEMGRFGAAASPVQLEGEFRGDLRPAFARELPRVAWRMGIDLAPVDVCDADAARWLQALVWPEHRQRRELLDAALSVACAAPPLLLAGDALTLLPRVLANAEPGLPPLPDDAVLCIYHSFTLNQFAPDARAAFERILIEGGQARPLYRVGLEWLAQEPLPRLELTRYHDGAAAHELLARCESHGRWLEWLAT